MARLPVGAAIRARREQKGLSQFKLAEATDLTSQHLSLVERGHNTTLDTLTAIATALGCNVSDLILEAEALAGRKGKS